MLDWDLILFVFVERSYLEDFMEVKSSLSAWVVNEPCVPNASADLRTCHFRVN